jgi:hypothetical protein
MYCQDFMTKKVRDMKIIVIAGVPDVELYVRLSWVWVVFAVLLPILHTPHSMFDSHLLPVRRRTYLLVVQLLLVLVVIRRRVLDLLFLIVTY